MLGPRAARIRSLSAQRAAKQIRAKATARSRRCAPEREEPADIFVYDPEVPVLAPGGPAAASGQFDQAALEMGNNVLVYTTEPLDRASVRFSACRALRFTALLRPAHTDFTAKLVRVTPNGAAEFICIGIARSSWLFAEAGYAADKIHHWEFDLEPTSCRFAAGDRIRLEIASSAFPLLRPQSRQRRAFLPRHFVGLAALDANRLSRQRASLGALPARRARPPE